MVLVLLTFKKWTNTNTILTVGIVFQYNTSHIVHLCVCTGHLYRTSLPIGGSKSGVGLCCQTQGMGSGQNLERREGVGDGGQAVLVPVVG